MITEQEWLRIYHECCHIFGGDGHTGNRVRVKIGQFKDDDGWACIEVVSGEKELLRKLFDIADKYNLRCDFQGNYEFKLWENYVEEKEKQAEGKNE